MPKTVHFEFPVTTRLYTEIYTPESTAEDLPIIFTRTPYGVRTANSSYGDYRLKGAYKTLAEEKYIFVFQDMRGKYNSEGKYALLRPILDTSPTNESTDAFDTMDWLISNIPHNNGKIGMTGNSYNSWLAAMALINPHPALAAVNLQGTPADLYIGDDFYHQGAFRLSPSFGYAIIEHEQRGFKFENNDAYQWFLERGSLENINSAEFLNKENPYWNDFMAHLNYDEFWKTRSITSYLKNTTVPTLNVVGWWDDQDFYGSLKIYEQLEKHDSLNLNNLVAGPWYHAGWEDPDDYYKQIHLGGSVSTYYLTEIQAPWFKYHLKNEGDFSQAEATVYRTGKNQWENFSEWPQKENISPVKWYLNQGFKLSLDKPTVSNSYSSYISDPKNPVPYMEGTVPGFWQRGSLGWKADNQSVFTNRGDVLTWVSEPLTEDVDISGSIKMKLCASTSGTDCDWVVKLIDVFPSNYNPEIENTKYDMDDFQMLIADEVIRAKYRNDLSSPEPVNPNQIIEYKIDLLSKSHRFKKGHRIMIHIQSSWFPLIDMNPQKFIDIGKAKPHDYKRATQKIYHSEMNASYIELPTMKKPPKKK
ncbi:CocE/NonD family hydrolase [Anseongella ginsenosidimutans]|uniref:CocE/NonD family hydrolase n=1 Tax=Anseongella ginsenosidimutans TaxID=496056 RepID=UPI00104A9931|nr:CocE/NonD family hydrolase [Anseongella ginsenosidimutans]QEC53634.1 CocE/NonD family hydrolase [Anseongella ginsenosidimutans]